MRVLGKTIHKNTLAIGLGLLVLSGCEEPTTFVPTNSDQFSYYDQDHYSQASAVLQADYLFVVDYGFSMHNEVDSLVDSLDLFADYLDDENIDFKIGLVRGSTSSSGDSTRYIPRSLIGPALTSRATNLPALIDLQLEGFAASNGDNVPFLLEAARRVSSNTGLSFLREASQLVYVFVSDSDDQSVNHPKLGNRSLQSYTDSLRVKSDNSYVNARAWVRGMSSDCPVGTENGGNTAGTRLATVAAALNSGSSQSLKCLTDSTGTAASLEDLARNVTRATKRFKLRAMPSSGSVVVKVDGVTKTAGTHYDYVSATREVVFRTGHEPAPGSDLEILYSPILKLSGTPDEATIVVTVDGNDVLKSDTDGWRYSSAKNEILFTGSYKPEVGSEIIVTYQAK